MSVQRSTRVAEAIKEEVGGILLHRLKDARVESAKVSVTDVEVSRDLRHATIFVSVFGDDTAREETLKGLRSAAGYIRSEVGKVVKLRATPEIHFKLDTSIEHGANIMALLDRIKEDRESRERAGDEG
ncbi:MAG TPA: 30S ribosome-binding factor RbfA [Oscillatoriaceae cyanobacterium]